MQRALTASLLAFGLIWAQSAMDDSVRANGARYRVKITNLTNAQSFTPVLAATHVQGASPMFLEGTAASPELRALAEEGDVGPLTARLSGLSTIADIVSTAGLTPPGVTREFEIGEDAESRRLSMAAMLIPTNDAFVGINTALPDSIGEVRVVYAYAYDAGTEQNDELCSSIPGPDFSECGGPGSGARVGNGEGAITIHRGVRGVGDFDADWRDWQNPVARITIRRLS